MSAHAFAEPYAHNRRHLRHQVKHSAKKNVSAEIIPLIPRSVSVEKPIEIGYQKYRKLSSGLTTALVIGLHLVVFGYFYSQPVLEAVKKVEVPQIKLEKYVPPVIPPQVIEQPKKHVKKEQPKAIQRKETTNPNIIEQPIAPGPVTTDEAPPVEKYTEASADAGYLHNPAPNYPETAAEKGWEGTVVLSVLVQPDGKAKAIEVKQTSGKKILDQAAVQTVQRWTFAPALRGKTPVEGWVEVPIDFRLGNS